MPDGGADWHDIELLDDASKSLLGYFLHRWYRGYLDAVNEVLREEYEAGMILDLRTPTDLGRSMLFDFRALDLEKLEYLIGVYLYVYLSHKYANFRLMHRFDGKQVLFLRGYDVEGAVSAGGSVAAGTYTLDTMQFGATLRDLLGQEFSLFKVLSPMDLYWETVDAQRYFSGDYLGMQRLIGQRPNSPYLNATSWQAGVASLLDRMDHYIVYACSLTESAMWELDQLDTDGRRQRATVVFDEEAIAKNAGLAGLPAEMGARLGVGVLWSKEHSVPARTAGELHKYLSERFLVTTKEEFESHIEQHRSRIAADASPLAPGVRETWLGFEFHPALASDSLARLDAIATELDNHAASIIRDGVDCLPLLLAQVQLRIYASLLLGRHDHTGSALADYAAIMQAASDYYAPAGDRPGALSAENRDHLLATLQAHLELSRAAGRTLAALGKSHEFESIYATAVASWDATFESTKSSVAQFFAKRGAA
jgi:hypothetical protein